VVEFAGDAGIENSLGLDEFVPDVVQALLVPGLAVKEVLIINNFHQLSNNLQALQVAQVQLNLPEEHFADTAGFRLIGVLEPVAGLEPLVQDGELGVEAVEFVDLAVVGLEDALVFGGGEVESGAGLTRVDGELAGFVGLDCADDCVELG
jgi:hypothetical protein